MRRRIAGLMLLGALAAAAAPAAALPGQPELAELKRRVVQGYASLASDLYADCEVRAGALADAAAALVASPSEATLAQARQAWIEGRRVYGMTEVFRFYDGPIDSSRDGVESFLNAWPVDEAYIDSVAGAPGSGIINDPVRFPNLSATVLMLANESGGETNISAGWHAIEFLLWGQDLDPAGPGARPCTDYAPAFSPNAARRGEYLLAAVDLLHRQLGQVRAQWAPDADNYRRRFEAETDESVRKVLMGVVILSGFEMSGERMAVAYETRDQEQEHSCFSDTTLNDLLANEAGIAAVLRGGRDVEPAEHGLIALVRLTQPGLGDALQGAADRAAAALRAIPAPFDATIRAEDGSPARQAFLAAMTALDRQTDAFAALGAAWGYHVPLTPGD